MNYFVLGLPINFYSFLANVAFFIDLFMYPFNFSPTVVTRLVFFFCLLLSMKSRVGVDCLNITFLTVWSFLGTLKWFSCLYSNDFWSLPKIRSLQSHFHGTKQFHTLQSHQPYRLNTHLIAIYVHYCLDFSNVWLIDKENPSLAPFHLFLISGLSHQHWIHRIRNFTLHLLLFAVCWAASRVSFSWHTSSSFLYWPFSPNLWQVIWILFFFFFLFSFFFFRFYLLL